ncbi:DUF1493 family protein [Mangrovibacter phragmitis]
MTIIMFAESARADRWLYL